MYSRRVLVSRNNETPSSELGTSDEIWQRAISSPPCGYELHLCHLLGVPPTEFEARRRRALGLAPADASRVSRSV